MSRDASGSNNDMTTPPAGLTQRNSCGATLRMIGAPVEAQREKTAAFFPSKGGNIKVSSAHQV